MNGAREQLSEDLLGGTAAFCVLCCEIFAFGSLNGVDIDEADALLLGEAYGGASGLALCVVCDRFWWPGDFTDDVGLLGGQAAHPGYETARCCESFYDNALRQIFSGEQFLDNYFKLLFGFWEHPGGNLFSADLKQEFKFLRFRRA